MYWCHKVKGDQTESCLANWSIKLLHESRPTLQDRLAKLSLNYSRKADSKKTVFPNTTKAPRQVIYFKQYLDGYKPGYENNLFV